ncbi:Vacuolar protein sorting-associated protein 53 [Coemansia sp. RSA 1939]|nr:Vacuolar protein sorting-associated protein 53 [Coemansia sp. RSA 1939]
MPETKVVQSSDDNSRTSSSVSNSTNNNNSTEPPSALARTLSFPPPPGAEAAGTVQLDRSEFSVSQYVNRLFPSDSSLDGVDAVAASIKRRYQKVVKEIRQVVHEQSNSGSGSDSVQREVTKMDDKSSANAASAKEGSGVEATKAAIGELYTRISEMRAKARTSERMVLDITQDIKALDFAKRNLTHTTATMRRLQLLIGSVEQLRRMKDKRMYADAAKLVPAIDGLREGFAQFGNVKAVAALSLSAHTLQRALGSQAYQDVESAFDVPSQQQQQSQQSSQQQQGLYVGGENYRAVHDACLCLDALGEQIRVIDMYCDLQLRAYAAIFQLDDDVSQLENASRRYAWLRRILRNYSEEHASLFPDAWRVGEELSRKFSVLTRDHLSEIMATHNEIPVAHLMTAMTDTIAFETQCNKKFNIVPRHDADESQQTGALYIYEDTGAAAEPFAGLISCAFEPYLSIFISAEQAKFDAMVAKFQQEPVAVDNDPSLTVLASSTDLLYQFRESLKQCAALATGQAMVDLSQVFSRSLSAYARDVLTHKLPRISPQSAAAARTASLLDELKHVCLIVNTADYCASVATQLEQKIVDRVDSASKPKVTFSACRDALLTTINASIRVLVSGVVDTMCDPAFAALAQVPWQSLHMVGDQSSYVMLAVSAMDAAASSIRQSMSGSRYFRSFCDKFAARFTDRYMAAISKAGPISEVGAEQLLLDAQALKSALLAMPVSAAGDAGEKDSGNHRNPPPAAYARIVAQGVGKIEAILKAILASSDPPDALVDRFLLLFPAAPKDTFQQILALKGIRPAEQHVYSRALRRRLRDTAKVTSSAKERNTSSSAARDRSSAAASSAALQQTGTGSSELPGSATPHSHLHSTPEPKDAVPSHVAYGMSSSAPIASTRLQHQMLHQRSGLGTHSRLDSNASSSSSMVFGGGSSSVAGSALDIGTGTYTHAATARTMLNADPLGITGAEGSRSVSAQIDRTGLSSAMSSPGARQQTAATATTTPAALSSSFHESDTAASSDALNSPVLASLAANATATRTKINENFRKFMSNMRRN